MENVFTAKTLVDGAETKIVDYKSMFLFPTAVATLAALALAAVYQPPQQWDANLDGASAPAH
jgi:hypothetical protein